MTSDADRQQLLQIARDAILAHVTNQAIAEPPITGALAVRAGAFVSLHSHGELRGCIGHIEPDEPLGRVVPRCAIAAASEDPRFPAVTLDEMRAMEIELSLLGPLEPIATLGELEVGRHGVVVAQGRHRGLLLPQVAIEWKWDAATFAAHACRKAGLTRDAWRRGARLWRFEAEVFAESRTHSV